jgi:hypothetical protein
MIKHLSKLASANQARVALQSTNKVTLQTFHSSHKTFGQQLLVNQLLESHFYSLEERWYEEFLNSFEFPASNY